MSVYGISPVAFGSVSMTTTSRGPNDPEVGTPRREGNKDYLFVYNAGGASAPVGHGVIVSAVSGYSVTVSSVTDSGNGFCVGVIENNTFTTAAYTWVVTRGFVQVQMGANNSAAAGERLSLGTDGAWARHHSSATDTMRNGPCAVAMQALASGASGTAYLRSFF